MTKTKEEVVQAVNELYEEGEVQFTHEDDVAYYFKDDVEEIKVRKDDYALHCRMNGHNQWVYDFDLFE